MSAAHGLRFDGTQFWVVHRRREFGPFDYEWSRELDGIELWYGGQKFGEICSEDEIFADLKEFKLPLRVVEVASVVFGSTLKSILAGHSARQRRLDLIRLLTEHGCEQFLTFNEGPPAKG
jgi:hypothetical protein